ncbi:MAG: SAM-dependent chlorinase/fluorinase [Thermoprotei archaeon]
MEFTKIAFTSDFGYRDHYVAVVKATILRGITRSVGFIDVSHDVGRQNIRRAAYVVGVAGKYLDEHTIHLVVVDPTVGTNRRIVVFIPHGHCVFVAPDNGVLTLAYEWFEGDVYYAKQTTNRVSKTFHARDVFAPLVAEIVEGRLSENVEPTSLNTVAKLDFPAYGQRDGGFHGCVLYTDVFGDVITNIPNGSLDAPIYKLVTKGGEFTVRQASSYSVGSDKELLLIEGSEGYYEVAVNRGSAASVLGVSEGDEVVMFGAH